MSARVLIFLIALLDFVIQLVKTYLSDLQIKKPLPAEVADIYEPERYQEYLNYRMDNRKCGLFFTGISLPLMTLLIFSEIFNAIEKFAGHNPYYIFIITLLIFYGIEIFISIVEDYYDTFFIEEKYGLNKQSKKDFAKDTILDIAQSLLLLICFGLFITFVGERIPTWTKDFTISFWKALLLGVTIIFSLLCVVFAGALLSLLVLRLQYKFTPLPDGQLKDKIMALQESSKKKVKHLYVYDESKKTTSKNASLLRIFWYRAFFIADNFVNENSEDELLAVISHEIGHLKHKKNLLNYINYLQIVLLAAVIVSVISRPEIIFQVNKWIRASFNITVNNYLVWVAVISSMFTPIFDISEIFNNYRSRQEEHEADREAVKNGYGDALIATFKRMGSDELINVNPHPVIEFLDYDHPGMYQRIRAIKQAQ